MFFQQIPTHYLTWQEASVATLKLGIKTMPEYEREGRYKEDPKLPSNPRLFYQDYPGAKIFLGKKSQ